MIMYHQHLQAAFAFTLQEVIKQEVEYLVVLLPPDSGVLQAVDGAGEAGGGGHLEYTACSHL